MNRLFEDFFSDFGLEPFSDEELPLARFTPQVNVTEVDDSLRVKAELPGLAKDDINVTISNDMVTIEGEKKEECEEEKGEYHYKECSYGSFRRNIPLPAEVDEEKADASFKDGVLTITVPKSEQAKAKSKQIEIKGE